MGKDKGKGIKETECQFCIAMERNVKDSMCSLPSQAASSDDETTNPELGDSR